MIGQIKELGPDVRVITADMPMPQQNQILEEVRRLTEASKRLDEGALVGKLKEWLQINFGGAWHVVIVQGSYWMNYSHEPNCSLQFHLGSSVYILWRTPKY